LREINFYIHLTSLFKGCPGAIRGWDHTLSRIHFRDEPDPGHAGVGRIGITYLSDLPAPARPL
jgi:hypothetical protein